MLSDPVPPTSPSHRDFLPELPPPVPTHSHNICYPASHLLCPAGLSQRFCQHSYQNVPSSSLVSPLWPFPLSPDAPSFVAQPWHSVNKSPVFSGKGVTCWLYSQEIPGSFVYSLLKQQFSTYNSSGVWESPATCARISSLSQNHSVRRQKSILWWRVILSLL